MHRSVSSPAVVRSVIRRGLASIPSARILSTWILLVAAGCTASPIGDPCVPESIPPGGFDFREIYLETSSVQCRTRVCMVYRLQGDPGDVCGTPGATLDCVNQDELDTQIFCSCRCSVPAGFQANTPLCNCGTGFTCVEDIVTTGGDGVRGGYCVPCRNGAGDTRNLSVEVFDDCPTAS